jgi:hypothetical protein
MGESISLSFSLLPTNAAIASYNLVSGVSGMGGGPAPCHRERGRGRRGLLAELGDRASGIPVRLFVCLCLLVKSIGSQMFLFKDLNGDGS